MGFLRRMPLRRCVSPDRTGWGQAPRKERRQTGAGRSKKKRPPRTFASTQRVRERDLGLQQLGDGAVLFGTLGQRRKLLATDAGHAGLEC